MKKILMTCAFAAALMSASSFAATNSNASGTTDSAGNHLTWGDAEKLLREDLKQNTNDVALLLNLAFVLRSSERYSEAESLYEQVSMLDQNPVVAYFDEHSVVSKAPAKRLAEKGLNLMKKAQR